MFDTLDPSAVALQLPDSIQIFGSVDARDMMSEPAADLERYMTDAEETTQFASEFLLMTDRPVRASNYSAPQVGEEVVVVARNYGVNTYNPWEFYSWLSDYSRWRSGQGTMPTSGGGGTQQGVSAADIGAIIGEDLSNVDIQIINVLGEPVKIVF